MARLPRPGPGRGFTLAEVATACALAGVMAALALPGLRGQQLAGGRLDAVDALAKVEAAQARRYAHHGLYATELSQLDGAVALAV
jgi:type IV pilus assembly protein PilE